MRGRLMALVGVLVALVVAPSASVAAAPSPALSDAAKQQLALDVLERFVPHAESFWRPSDLAEPRTGRYDAVGSGVTQPRGAGNIAFAYVTLLEARPEQRSFGGVPRETMIDHTIQSIRHEALTNKLSGAGYDRWGGGSWQASLETYLWAFAAHRLWDRLDADTRALVRRVVVGEANILIDKPVASGVEGDTGAEDNGWNAPTTALASVMFPGHENAAAWRETTKKLAINASSRVADADATELVDGRPLGEWIASANLHPDLTMENHGFFNPIYQQVAHLTLGDGAVFLAAAGEPLPEALSFRTEEIWERILGPLATDDGDFALTAGQDWVSKDYQHLGYLAILATRFGRADASVLESRALQLVARRQASHDDGSILGQAVVGYETMLVKRLAFLWWQHELFGPSPEPTAEAFAAARDELAGVREFHHSDFIAARLGKAFVSMSWDPSRPLGLVVPHGEADLDDPIFSYYAPRNLIGSASGTAGPNACACEEDRFSTAGSIGDRRFSMTAFPDGTTLLLDRGTGATFTYALEDIPGLTGERPIHSEGGVGIGDLPGDWLNAADRLGMIVRGGSGLNARVVPGTNRQLVITGSTGTGSGHRGAVLLPLTGAQRTAELAPHVRQPAVPDDWSALSARADDGSVRLAVARWGGAERATLELTDERGAPVPEQDARIAGRTATFDLTLGAPASRGQTLRFLVDADGPVVGRQDGEDRAILRNPGGEPVTIAVTHVPAGGDAQTVRRTIAAGEEVVARQVGGELTLAGPELEPLLAAEQALDGLVGQLEGWQADGTIGASQAARTLPAARTALDAVTAAVAAARAQAPDAHRAAERVIAARRAVDRLREAAASAGLPADVRAAVDAAATEAAERLDEALAGGLAVATRIEALGTAHPGEPLTVRVTLLNRGFTPVTGGRVTVAVPDGWTAPAPVEAFDALPAGATATVDVTVDVPAGATVGEAVAITAQAGHRHGHRTSTTTATTTVQVRPVLVLEPSSGALPLAVGGVNVVAVSLHNQIDRPLEVELAAAAPEGATATPERQTVTVPPRGSAEATVTLAATGRTSGTGTLAVTATTAGGAESTSEVEVRFGDDLARNGTDARWPRATATSSQASYVPALANDGDRSTFWVSGGPATPGNGPTPERPELLTVELAGPARIGSVTMAPRTNYGPRAYAVEVSDDGETWREVAAQPSAPNAVTTSTFTPVTARFVRLRITDTWDRQKRNVQVAALEVRAP